jgi:hypothetical protein
MLWISVFGASCNFGTPIVFLIPAMFNAVCCIFTTVQQLSDESECSTLEYAAYQSEEHDRSILPSRAISVPSASSKGKHFSYRPLIPLLNFTCIIEQSWYCKVLCIIHKVLVWKILETSYTGLISNPEPYYFHWHKTLLKENFIIGARKQVGCAVITVLFDILVLFWIGKRLPCAQPII